MFQQELLVSRQQQQQHHQHQQLLIHQQHQLHQQQQQQLQQQQQQTIPLLPSIMVPPQSPTLSSYYFENNGGGGWINHYNDPKRRHYLSTRQQYELILNGAAAAGTGPGLVTIGPSRKRTVTDRDTNQYLTEANAIAAAASAAITTTTNIPMMQPYNNNESWRESLLQFAHGVYSVSPQNPFLLDLLHKLHLVAPTHLPTLLLLACVYYSFQDYRKSLEYNHLILKYDATYVEAMSNIGTTLKSLGKAEEAEKWWYEAVKLRPGYWDAVENLVGVLCSTSLRYKEALAVCEFVEKSFTNKAVQTHQLPRLLNLFYAKGNLKYALGDVLGAQKEYEKGLQLAFGGMHVESVCQLLAFACHSPAERPVLVLLFPEQAVRVLHLLFPGTDGLLPGLNGAQHHADIVQQTNQTTSTLLLTLAKLFQDIMNPTTTALANAATKGVTPSLAVLLPLYYISLALHQSPSTTNNLGIILSNISPTLAETAITLGPTIQPLTGTTLAMRYYLFGIHLDPRHPHLYTNLGSLLKDMGHLNEAVNMYEKAVEFNPRFDVALANLGNAIKDLGRVQESVQWYRRAVEVNPNFVDAICGLVNSLSGVCDWRGRGTVGGEASVDTFGNYFPASLDMHSKSGWIGHVVDIVEKQLNEGAIWGAGILKSPYNPTCSVGDKLVQMMMECVNSKDLNIWKNRLGFFLRPSTDTEKKDEGGWLIRLVERIMRRLQHKWYIDTYGQRTVRLYERIVVTPELAQKYQRPLIPSTLTCPPVPTVLPFHTFTYPLSARQIRLISHRNALRISHTALTSSWVPTHVYPPPPPPSPRIKLGYVSSDFNNHPLSHLMQSVFGFHDTKQFEVYCYATTESDNSPYRLKIESESEHFLNVSHWNHQQIVEKIVEDGIHILVNLNGYTKGARNEIFAARPCPVQCSFMGFAGTLAGGWCDWIIADPIVCPPSTVSGEVWRQRGKSMELGDFEGDIDPEEGTDDFVYTEKFIYMPHSYFVNDHKQGFRDDHPTTHQELMLFNQKANEDTVWAVEEEKRWKMRREVFPHLPDDVIIFANFNQLYKLEPGTFRSWLRILERVPNSILWLLRFPPAGEDHLKRFAIEWAGHQVAQRVVFTDVAPKHVHIHRGRVADIFLDTPECNAHTTAADILWSGTPIVTYPKYMHKMCSRVGASIAMATGFGDEMVVMSEEQYEERVVELAQSVSYTYQTNVSGNMLRRGHGALMDLRRRLFMSREQSRLFDTQRWTRNLESGFKEAWRRWVTTEEFDDLRPNEKSGCIWVVDPDDAAHP